MPRVSNESKDVANRMIDKCISIKIALRERDEALELLKVSDPKSLAYRMSSAAIQRIDTDLQSVAGSILSIHEKVVTRDWNKFVDFITDVSLNHFRNDADTIHQESFDKVFSS
jgi:hypothetical protein